MAVTIVATVGSASANSFVTLAEAATYAEARLNASTWETSATTDNKNRALVEATRELSALVWQGKRTDSTQALSWPRQVTVDPDNPSLTYFASTVIPTRVKDATCELALAFIKSGTTDLAALDATANITRQQIDVLSTEYAEPFARATGLRRFPRVWALVAPMLNTRTGTVSLVRG